MPWPAIITGAATIGGALLGMKGQKEANQQNLEASQASALQQMRFQKKMSDTAHRREVRDLRKAGLNPILTATGGGGAPGAPGAGYQANAQNELADVANSAMAIRRNVAEVKNLEAINSQIDADTELKRADRMLRSVDYNVRLYDQFLRRQEYETEQWRTEEAKYHADIMQSNAKGRRLEGEIDETKFGELMRYIDRALDTVGTGSSAVGKILGRGGKATPPGVRPPYRSYRFGR